MEKALTRELQAHLEAAEARYRHVAVQLSEAQGDMRELVAAMEELHQQLASLQLAQRAAARPLSVSAYLPAGPSSPGSRPTPLPPTVAAASPRALRLRTLDGEIGELRASLVRLASGGDHFK